MKLRYRSLSLIKAVQKVEFKIIVANHVTGEYRLNKNHIFVRFQPHSGTVVPTSITLMEILVVIEEASVLKDFTVENSATYDEVF